MSKDNVMTRKLQWGMIGGGPGAFIGEVHRKAARMDGQIELVAGAFDINPDKSKQMGALQYIDPKRAYGSYREMIEKESALPAGERVDFVSICVPNNFHFPIAKAFLEAGFHVVCEKPMTMDVKEAKQLCAVVKKTGKVFALTHNYTGYPMVKLARDLVKKGHLGKLLKINVEYPQGWLLKALEKTGNQQASWRTDPKQAGAAGAIGDIGTHAENLAEYITGLQMVEICADLTSFVPGRKLDDDASVLVHWEKGVKGTLLCSQVSIGEENALKIRVYGEKAMLEWRQEYPNDLVVNYNDKPAELWRRGNPYIGAISPAAVRGTRLPGGHPEAFIEAFGNIYANATETMRCKIAGKKPSPLALDYPDVYSGLRGMQFIEAVVKSGKAGAKWVKMEK